MSLSWQLAATVRDIFVSYVQLSDSCSWIILSSHTSWVIAFSWIIHSLIFGRFWERCLNEHFYFRYLLRKKSQMFKSWDCTSYPTSPLRDQISSQNTEWILSLMSCSPILLQLLLTIPPVEVIHQLQSSLMNL